MPVPPEALLILGARRFAREVADIASEIPAFSLAGFVENQERERCSESLLGLPVHWVDELPLLSQRHVAVCAFGSTQRRAFIDRAAADGMRFALLVHPGARISTQSELGAGSVAWPGVVVSSYTRVGQHVLLNRGALVGHDVEIGDCVTLAPGANIAGCCRVGSGAFVGMGSCIVERVVVGEHSVIAAGAVVTRDVPDHVMVAGAPARIVKRGVTGL